MKGKIAFLLFCSLLLPLFVSCSGNAPGGASPSNADSTTVDPSETEEYPSLPDNTNFDGYEFVTLMSGLSIGNFNDFSSENEGFSVVSEAIFKRNEIVCAFFDCSMTNVEDFEASWGGGPGFRRMRDDYSAGEASYDICEVGTFDAPQIAVNGYAYDLKELPGLDLNHSWWDQQANRDLCIVGRMYYTTGAISVVDNLATHCILFSKQIAEEKGITDLYQLVEDQKWTYDRFSAYALSVSDDLDGNDVMDLSDRYGVLCWNDAFQGSFAGAKSRICGVDEEGKIVNTLYSDKNLELAEKICTLLFDQKVSYNYVNRGVGNSSGWKAGLASYFAGGHGLFLTTMLSTVSELRESEMDFGILPYPMYDEEQGEYGAYLGATYSVMLCVENFTHDLERTGAFLEMLAYHSQRLVSPAYYEQTLKGRDTRDDESSVCLDIIFASRTFDLGAFYQIGGYTGKLTSMMQQSRNLFTRIYESSKNAAQTKIDEINQMFAQMSE